MVGRPAAPASRLGTAASRFLTLFPALVLALLCVRAVELTAALPAGTAPAAIARAAGLAVLLDALALLRYLPVLFLVSLPGLFGGPLARGLILGALWSLLVFLQTVLTQYFLTTRVPLGADLFGYTLDEIRKAGGAGADLGPATAVAVFLPLAVLWVALVVLIRRPPWVPAGRASLVMLVAAAIAMPFLPSQPRHAGGTTDLDHLVLNKGAFFVEDSLAHSSRPAASASAEPPGEGTLNGFAPLDPQYPFLHAERTPEVLGAHLAPGAQAPNLVIILVEGLGRGFSGPGAALRSFTPFLDRLAAQSLYWENFLATQGRTFAALPSVLGSLPFGEQGLSSLAERIPAHVSLPSLLKEHGYHLAFYAGFSLDFDSQRWFLERQRFDTLVGIEDFPPEYPRSPGANSWGYADGELVTLALERQAALPQPYFAMLQTVTMHTPYTFPDQESWDARFEEHLARIGVPEEDRPAYREFRGIYTSILYTDAALERFFDAQRQRPEYANTIYVVTGDHRLPELPMTTRIDRYHVPLIIHSPLLRAPARFKAVSSHFDLAPSLLAYVARHHGLRSPSAVTWMGPGLDAAEPFRSLRDIPLKQTKAHLTDFVSGPWYLNDGVLYRLGDNMTLDPADDAAARARVTARFERLLAANNQLVQTLKLMPDTALTERVAFRETDRRAIESVLAAEAVVAVRDVRAPSRAQRGELTIEIDLGNGGAVASAPFVPLVVVLAEDGREVSESYGPTVTLGPGQSLTVPLAVKSSALPAGLYHMAVIPSDPETGKSVGAGRYRIPVRLD